MKRVKYEFYVEPDGTTGTTSVGTDAEWSSIVKALRTAAVEYDKIGRSFPSLNERMWKQRDEALRLADEINRGAGAA